MADSYSDEYDEDYEGDSKSRAELNAWAEAHARAAARDDDEVPDREQQWALHSRSAQEQAEADARQKDREDQERAAAEVQRRLAHAASSEAVFGEPAAYPDPSGLQDRPTTAGQRPQPTYRADELISALPVHREAPAEKGVRGILGMRPGAAERSERIARDIAATSFRRPVTVVVANPKGGSGKTPTTLLLAGGLGQARGGGVVAWDNNELRGNMHLRTHETNPRSTVTDLLRAMPMLTKPDARLGDVASYLRHQIAGQYDVLTSATTTYAQIEAADFQQIHRLLSRYYRVLVIDTGNNEGSSNWREAMKAADVLVIPIKWKSLSCAAAVQMLEELDRQGPAAQRLIRHAVVAVSNGPGEVNKEIERKLRPYFESRAVAMIDIPTDPHIAEEGALDHAALQPSTRRASLELAARVAEQLTLRLNSHP